MNNTENIFSPESAMEFVGQNIIEVVVKRLELQEPLSQEFLKVVFECVKLFDKKQTDYGPTNIAKFGDYGVLVRISDKIERLANLYKKRKRKGRVSESVEDTLRDVANYAIISIMWQNGKWPR